MQVGRVTIRNRFCKKEVISIRLFEKKTIWNRFCTKKNYHGLVYYSSRKPSGRGSAGRKLRNRNNFFIRNLSGTGFV
jgi:hypothetical protein